MNEVVLAGNADWLDQPESTAVAVAAPVAKRDAKIVTLFRSLSDRQKTVLRTLQLYNFNVSKTLKILATVGDGVEKTSYHRWVRQDKNFAFVLKAMKAKALEAIDPARTLLRLDEIAEDALRPKDVFFKGAPTGEKRKDYTASLKATELQMKNQKLLASEDEKPGFGGRQISLSVQVVMPGGELKDVKRTGVVIDMPVIELPDAS